MKVLISAGSAASAEEVNRSNPGCEELAKGLTRVDVVALMVVVGRDGDGIEPRRRGGRGERRQRQGFNFLTFLHLSPCLSGEMLCALLGKLCQRHKNHKYELLSPLLEVMLKLFTLTPQPELTFM